MVGLPGLKHAGPIGVDLGTRSLKLLQFDAAREHVVEAVRIDLRTAAGATEEEVDRAASAALHKARSTRRFVGRDVVLCVGGRGLAVQNIRVPKVAASQFAGAVREEASGRLPFPLDETELRYLEAADVRQGDAVKRETILLACRRPRLEALLHVVEEAGLRPVAVDAEPVAILRCFARQFRRDSDQQVALMLVHVGATTTVVVIERGGKALFIKYLDICGEQLDEAVARHLQMEPAEAARLRRTHGDARGASGEDEITRTINDATRRVVDQLGQELALCARYYSVTFRGQPIQQVLLAGGEASPSLAEALGARLEIPCELGDPLRHVQQPPVSGRRGQWDVVTGLAMREVT